METLIVQPKTKEQLTALKAIMKALKVDFKTEKSEHSTEFVAKMKQSEEDIKAGRITKIKLDETDRILANPAMVKRLEESRKQIEDGKGIKISLDDIWK
jgi:hypothetical protein